MAGDIGIKATRWYALRITITITLINHKLYHPKLRNLLKGTTEAAIEMVVAHVGEATQTVKKGRSIYFGRPFSFMQSSYG